MTFERPFANVFEHMYATGYGIRPMRSSRRVDRLTGLVRGVIVLGAIAAVSGGLANVLVR